MTGMSGAGRTTCLKMLEDLGYEAVDNLPVNLLGPILRGRRRRPGPAGDRGRQPHPRLRAGADRRRCSRRPRAGVRARLLFLDCDDEVLRRRFTETRGAIRWPDLPGVADALAAERELMAPLKAAADLVIDTTRAVAAGSAPPAGRPASAGAPEQLSIAVVSFAYRHGLPREADLVFDVRFLHNPHYVDELRPRDRARPGRAGAHPGRSGVRRRSWPGSRRCCCRCCRGIRPKGRAT